MRCRASTSHIIPIVSYVRDSIKKVINRSVYTVPVILLVILTLFSVGMGSSAMSSSTGKAAGIVLTFDDMPVSDWYNARDLLNRYGVKATFYVNDFDQLPPEYLAMLQVLKNDGHEVACHGYRHIDAVSYLNGHTTQDYVNVEILPAISLMNNYGFYPTSFAYPGGSRNSATDAALLGYFKILRGVGNIGSPYGVAGSDQFYYQFKGEKVVFGAWTDNGGYTTEQFIAGLQRAGQNGEILITFGHMIRETNDVYATPPSKLEAILQYAQNNNLKFYRMSDLPS